MLKAGVLMLTFLAVACGAVCPSPSRLVGLVPCEPYIEASAPLAIPPSGSVAYAPGTPLAIASVVPGRWMLELTARDGDQVRGLGGGRVYFERDATIATGVLAHAGAAGELKGGQGDAVSVKVSNNQTYIVPCKLLSASRPVRPPREPPTVPRDRLRAVAVPLAYLVPAKDDGSYESDATLWTLGAGEHVELVSRDGDRVEVRVHWQGFTYQGLMADSDGAHNVLRGDLLAAAEFPESVVWEGQPDEDVWLMSGGRSPYGMVSMGEPCVGAGRLRPGAPLLSGPLLTREAREKVLVKEVGSFPEELRVAIIARAGAYRSVEIQSPSPNIKALVAWVRDDDLAESHCGSRP